MVKSATIVLGVTLCAFWVSVSLFVKQEAAEYLTVGLCLKRKEKSACATLPSYFPSQPQKSPTVQEQGVTQVEHTGSKHLKYEMLQNLKLLTLK